MKKTFILLSAILMVGSFVNASIVIGDFTIPPASTGPMNGFSNLDTNTVDTWRVNPNPGAAIPAGEGAVIDAGAGDGYVRLARNFSDSQRLVLGIMLDVDAAGLTANTDYRLQFDYTVDRIGARAYDTGAWIKYGVAALDANYNQLNASTSLTDFTLNTPANGSILINYSDVTQIATPGQTAWTTYTSSLTFSFAPGTDKLGVMIQGSGYGVGNNNWPSTGEYTYLGIDNVMIIPEPSVLALLGLSVGFLIYVRRRR